jgi:NAD(P)-dependent dehydrogenase (short-subunit alcohol dehydrogenase family)
MREQKTILITGAAGGIGSATAERFLAEGWKVALTDVNAESLIVTSKKLGEIPFCVSDIRRPSECKSTIDWAAGQFGRLDVLVNSAGVWREGPTELSTPEDFDVVFDVNVKGTYFMSAAAIPHLIKTEGLIINLSSDAGLQGNTGAALYCASKGAVSLLTKALALELAPQGVRVNAICPGDVFSPMLENQARRYGNGDEAGYLNKLLSGYPQGPKRSRFIQPDEIASFIHYLAKSEATPITGATLSIDFGYSAGK